MIRSFTMASFMGSVNLVAADQIFATTNGGTLESRHLKNDQEKVKSNNGKAYRKTKSNGEDDSSDSSRSTSKDKNTTNDDVALTIVLVDEDELVNN